MGPLSGNRTVRLGVSWLISEALVDAAGLGAVRSVENCGLCKIRTLFAFLRFLPPRFLENQSSRESWQEPSGLKSRISAETSDFLKDWPGLSRPTYIVISPLQCAMRNIHCAPRVSEEKLANTGEAREYRRSSRIQEKLALARRSSRIQEKLANTAEARVSEQKLANTAEAREYSRSSR